MTRKPTVLITGCSQGGLGDALARQFADKGYHVFAAVRSLSKAANYSNTTASNSIEVVSLDVTSSESIKALEADLQSSLPECKLDVLINNAGFGATGPLLEADLAIAKRIYEVNVLGLLAVTQAFAPRLVAAKGKVVNVSSVRAILTLPWSGTSILMIPLRPSMTTFQWLTHNALSTLSGLYHSSKAAVTMMSETLRLELAPLGVAVITAMLGNIESNFHLNDSWQGLPPSSRYKSVESHIAKTAEGKIGPKKEKAEDFARRFVEDILRDASGQVWRGAMAQTDGMVLPGSGLDVMAKEATGK
ncbi:MAG: hypothetical protein Q9207_007433 [Kuettlingeria erythrocarpa]